MAFEPKSDEFARRNPTSISADNAPKTVCILYRTTIFKNQVGNKCLHMQDLEKYIGLLTSCSITNDSNFSL